MFFKKRYEKKKNEMRENLIKILPKDITLVSFEYYPKIFGNIVIKLNSPTGEHKFVADRGEIYHNIKITGDEFWRTKFSCDNSYIYLKKEDTFNKLLQVIKKELRL